MSFLLSRAIYHPAGGRRPLAVSRCPLNKTLCFPVYPLLNTSSTASETNKIKNPLEPDPQLNIMLCYKDIQSFFFFFISNQMKGQCMLGSIGDFGSFIGSSIIKSVSGLSVSQLSEINHGYQYNSPDIIILVLFN